MSYIPTPAFTLTRFGEQLIALRTSQMNFKPTWGVSTLRYVTVTTGTGAAVGEVDGEFLLQSGTSNSSDVSIRTNQRGLYESGAMGQAGIGVRIPTLPTSTAFCEWGYTDFANGFYFGVDGTGKYIAYVTGSSATKVYQSSWNIDKLDGTGASGYTLNLADGNISQIDFTWYGYGDIEFSYLIYDSVQRKIIKTVCHRTKITGAVSVIDPNQPLMFRVGNGASTTTNVSMYIGGHQFSTVEGDSAPQSRAGGELVTSYTTATNTNWQPLIAFRKMETFNGRANSVRVRLSGMQVSADGDMQTRYTVGGVTSNLSWGTPTGRTATETAVETKVTGGTALTTSSDGEPFEYGFVAASGSGGNRGGVAILSTDISLGRVQEVILWIRRLSGAGAIVVKTGVVSWTEEW